MSSTTSQLPPTCRALVLPAVGQPLEVQTITTPDAITGSVVVRVLVCGVDATMSNHLQGHTPGLTLSTPFVCLLPHPSSLVILIYMMHPY